MCVINHPWTLNANPAAKQHQQLFAQILIILSQYSSIVHRFGIKTFIEYVIENLYHKGREIRCSFGQF